MPGDAEIPTEQREDDRAAVAAALARQQPQPRGRPWVKGQSGNPKGRPSRAHQAAFVAHALIDRNTLPLVRALIARALAGDRTAMRLCIERLAPPRREAPAYLPLPPIESQRDLAAALCAVADAAATGAISAPQSAALVRMLSQIYPFL